MTAIVPQLETAQDARAVRLEALREQALQRTGAAVRALRDLGVTAVLTGSLAKGDFGETSDIDLLVTQCPRQLKYAIEGVVEDHLKGFSFDVIYLDEVPPARIASFTGPATLSTVQ